jgi:hypothetical protein
VDHAGGVQMPAAGRLMDFAVTIDLGRKRRNAGERCAGGQPGDVLDCVDTRTWQPGRGRQRYRTPALSSRAAVTECVITTETNGSGACVLDRVPPHGGLMFRLPVYRTIRRGFRP